MGLKNRIVVRKKDEYGVLGVFSSKFINGRSSDWSIELVNKYYYNNETEIGNIVIRPSNWQKINPKRSRDNPMKITTPHTQLFWDKFHTPNYHYYDISECPTLTFSFELRINGLEVTWLGTTYTFKSKKALTKFIGRLCDGKPVFTIDKDYVEVEYDRLNQD